MNYDYETELNNLKEAQKKASIADLENTRNQTLSDLQAERASNASTYNQARNTASAQNRMNARNFQEYLASTGRANSGLSAQARMFQNNNLGNNLSAITSAENASNADINRRATNANNTYNSGLTSANATIEANYINNLLSQQEKQRAYDYQKQQDAIANDLAERKLQESIRQYNADLAEQQRQYNENMALQRQKLYSSFTNGSTSSNTTNNSTNNYGFTDTSSSSSNNPLGLTKQQMIDLYEYGRKRIVNGFLNAGNSTSNKSSTSSNAITANNIPTSQLNALSRSPRNNGVVIELTGGRNTLGYEVNGHVYYKENGKWTLYR